MFTEERQNAIEKCLREKGKVRSQRIKRDVSGYGGLYPQGSQDP